MKKLCLLICLILFVGKISAQTTITGTVTDENSTPLPGVNVVVKGSSSGTITDVEGSYSIDVAEATVLIFSFMGYNTDELETAGKSIINLQMTPKVEALDEVVVVGYGTMKKSDVTGSITSIKSEHIKEMPVSNVVQAMQGRAGGVQVTNSTGAPGSGIKVRIRGTGSMSGSNEPLYIIDGIPISNENVSNPQTGGSAGDQISSLSNINMDDVEDIQILKDAASCAIYGARGANGVVLITTKRGKTDGHSIELSTYYGISESTNKLDILNAKDYQQYVYEGVTSMRGWTPDDWRFITDEEVEANNTDWQDEIFRKAATSNVNLTFRGGDERTQYMLSSSYYNQEGIIIETGMKRYGFRVNLDHKIGDRLKVGTSLSTSLTTGQRQRQTGDPRNDANSTLGGPVLMSALAFNPAIPVYNEDGSYGFDKRMEMMNPVAMAKEQSLDYSTKRVFGNLFLEWEIINNLSFRTSFGVDMRDVKEEFFFSPLFDAWDNQVPGSGRSSITNFDELIWVSTNTLNYNVTLGENHNISALAGIEFQESTAEGNFTQRMGYVNDKITNFSGGTATDAAINSLQAYGLESYFSRLSYSYGGRYMATINARYDGSSRFGPNNQYGFFPSASIGWNIANESFFRNNISFIDDMKFRASVGVTGNQNIGNYSWRGAMTIGRQTAEEESNEQKRVLNYLDKLGAVPKSIANMDYSWEEHTQINLGVDMAFLRNRVNVTVELYKRISDQLLLPIELPSTTGFTSIIGNAGKMTNKGIEFELLTYNTTGKFKWTTSLNIAANRNEVNTLVSDSVKNFTSMMYEGGPISFYTYRRQEYVDSLSGWIILDDIDGDGQISYGGGYPDRTVVGSPFPEFFGGITNEFQYMGFDLSIFFQFSYGNDIYNVTRQTMDDLQLKTGFAIGNNITQEQFDNRFLKRDITDDEGNVLYPENRHTMYPYVNWEGRSKDQREGHNGWVEDGSYLRLKTLTFGYTFPLKWTQRIKIQTARIYFSSNNLMTWTNYSGFDPEVDSVNGDNLGANISTGVDAGSYPQARTYIFGINLNF